MGFGSTKEGSEHRGGERDNPAAKTAAARACDQAARARLGVPRQNSVFSAPCRQTLDSPDFASASAINRRLSGKGITRQLWGILPKIKSVD